MSLSKPIVIFKDAYYKEWETYTQALVATCLQDAGYFEDYKLKQAVEAITSHFYLREKKDETIRPSESNEPTEG